LTVAKLAEVKKEGWRPLPSICVSDEEGHAVGGSAAPNLFRGRTDSLDRSALEDPPAVGSSSGRPKKMKKTTLFLKSRKPYFS